MIAEAKEPELVFISMGSNIAPESNLLLALQRLADLGDVIRTSKVYQNPAKGPLDQSDFLNAAVLIETKLAPIELRSRLREIEAELGRKRPEAVPGLSQEELKFIPRPIDLDIALYGSIILTDEGLEIPDPEIRRQPHLAIPLAEVAPDFLLPGTDEPLGQIAASLADQHEMRPRPDVRLKDEITPRIEPTQSAASGMGNHEDES